MHIDYTAAKKRIKNYLRILVTDQCNLNCVYCHKEGRHTGLNAHAIEQNGNFDLRAVLKNAKEAGIQKIKISGGEPLLFPDILSICEEFQDDFVDIGFTTNGTELLKLENNLKALKTKKLSFNVSLNSLDKDKYAAITGSKTDPQLVVDGIRLLIRLGYKVKLNSVITSYNFDDIEQLVTFAAKQRIDIKLLDLFTVSGTPSSFQRISIAEIKDEITKLFTLDDSLFSMENDYLCAKALGIRILLPNRIYSMDCHYNCPMYPCAEGLFGIRVYEDYSCSPCFKEGELRRGDINTLQSNIEMIRNEIENTRMGF